jgi:hypothetical protein
MEVSRPVGHLGSPVRAGLLGLALVGLATSCTFGGSDEGGGGDVASAEAPSRTPPSEPPATDPEGVRPYLVDLLARYDDVVNQIVVDPSVAGDREHPLVEDYLSLFEPDSQFAEDALAAWVDDGESGRSVQPYDESRLPFTTYVDGDIEVLAQDEVVFPLCVERRTLVYEDDVLRQQTPFFADVGSGAAVRVDGRWRLRSLGVSGGQASCGGGGAA